MSLSWLSSFWSWKLSPAPARNAYLPTQQLQPAIKSNELVTKIKSLKKPTIVKYVPDPCPYKEDTIGKEMWDLFNGSDWKKKYLKPCQTRIRGKIVSCVS